MRLIFFKRIQNTLKQKSLPVCRQASQFLNPLAKAKEYCEKGKFSNGLTLEKSILID